MTRMEFFKQPRKPLVQTIVFILLKMPPKRPRHKFYPPQFSQMRSDSIRACVLRHFSRVRLFVTPWTAAPQALLAVGFSRQEHWSELPCPPPGVLPDQRLNPCLLHLLHWQASSLARPDKPDVSTGRWSLGQMLVGFHKVTGLY